MGAKAYIHEVKIAVYLASHGIVVNHAVNDNLIALDAASTSSVVVFQVHKFVN